MGWLEVSLGLFGGPVTTASLWHHYGAVVNLTLKDVPAELPRKHKRRADENHRSLNWVVIDIQKRVVNPKPCNVEELLAEARRLRESVLGPLITDSFLREAKDLGAPMIVVDTNVICYLLLTGPDTGLGELARQRDEWCAPILWGSEFRSALAVLVRRGLLTVTQARQRMELAERLLWGREMSVRSIAVFDGIARSNRSAHDCEFVALASAWD